VQHAAFRIVQEALSNVYRHAGASTVEVDLTCRAGMIVLQVKDDGRGLRQDPRQADPDGPAIGVGISGMLARVEQLDGKLEIISDGTGALVRASLPLG